MPMNRSVWRKEFDKDALPAWSCPHCRYSTLVLVEKSFQRHQGADSRAVMSDSCYIPEDDAGAVCFLVKCSRGDCREVCAVAGRYYMVEFDIDDRRSSRVTICVPSAVVPPPPLIRLPDGCPESMRKEATRAFSLYWADAAACLNSIRQAVELFLTDLGIPKSHKVAKPSGGRRLVKWKLHDRIGILEKRRPALKPLCGRLMAVKHLGNAGSHPGEVTDRDALDGFEILEAALAAVYDDADSLDRAVREINRRRGPRRRPS